MVPPSQSSSKIDGQDNRRLRRSFLACFLAGLRRHYSIFAPKSVSGAVNEHILQRRLAHAERLNFSRERLDHFRHEVMSVFNFQPDVFVHDSGVDLKLIANTFSQRLRITRFEQNYVAADLAGQRLWCAESYQIPFIQNSKTIAAFRFFHQVRGDDDRDALLVAENCQILPKVASGAGIEAGCRLVEQQYFRMMEQALGEFDAALHAAGKSLHQIARAVEQSHARENFVDAHLKLRAAQAIEMSLMPKIFVGGELGVDALCLKHHADTPAQGPGLAHGIEAGDRRAAGSGHHERRENAKQSRLAAAIWPEQSEEFRRANVERNPVERGAVLVTMHQVAHANDGLATWRDRLGGRSEVESR